MIRHNPNNERIKRKYLCYLKEAKQHSEVTVDAVAMALARFEEHAKFRDFKAFRYEQAIAFKRHLSERNSSKTGKKLSKATLYTTLAHLKRFFQWLSDQQGYKSRLKYCDADYFSLSDKESRVATARRESPYPTLEQITDVISRMPAVSDIELRDRALVSFTILTGARDGAIASIKLKHVDLVAGSVFQDARDVKTKFSKSFTTYFFPVGDEIWQIVIDWVNYLREEKLWSNNDPLFPSTNVIQGKTQQFEVVGLKREHWSNTEPIRKIFREAFSKAGLPYFNPHSFRKTLVHLGMTVCQTPEEFKVWSQNLGHDDVLTTFHSYGTVSNQRQREIIQNLGGLPRSAQNDEVVNLAEAVLRIYRP